MCCSNTPSTELVAAHVQAYVDELSRDLQAECGAYGVTVENQAPFYVATKMSKIRRPRLDAPSPAAWVRSVGIAADVVDPPTEHVCHWSRKLASYILGVLCRRLRTDTTC
jgi:short-subunit dehydrogenase